MSLPRSIDLIEVGPRDGLQNERKIIPTSVKIELVNRLSKAGFREIEVSSFVSPKWVPQLADAAEVFAGIDRHEGVTYSALVPNEQGLERALAFGVDKIAVFLAASETFSQRNTNGTIAEVLTRTQPVVRAAREAGLPVRGYISCVVACPFEGPIEPLEVRSVAESLLEMGVTEIDLGETIGVAVPRDMDQLYSALNGLLKPADTTLHLHDTRGTALVCAHHAMQMGVTRFDASCGGLGGCPYAPGAAGNLATEDLIYYGRRMGIETGVDLDAVLTATQVVASSCSRSLTGRMFVAERGALSGDSSCAS